MSETKETCVVVRWTHRYHLTSAHMKRPLKTILAFLARFREIARSRSHRLYWPAADRDFQLVLGLLKDTRHSEMKTEFFAEIYYPQMAVDANGKSAVIVKLGNGHFQKEVKLRDLLTSLKRVQHILNEKHRYWEPIVELYDDCIRRSRGTQWLTRFPSTE